MAIDTQQEVLPDDSRIVDLRTIEQRLVYDNLNFTALRSDRDEVFRFLWQNADALGIERDYYLAVESVRPSVRVGPDGLIVNEVVADYIQTLKASKDPGGVSLARLGPVTEGLLVWTAGLGLLIGVILWIGARS